MRKTRSKLQLQRILNENSASGQTDLEQKSLAEEREAYKGTPSEETRIKQKTLMKIQENHRFSTLIP